MLKRWTVVFRALANINRLKIITILSERNSKTVGELARDLDISPKSTSKHLIILKNLDILESRGKDGHVHYSISNRPPRDIRFAIRLFINKPH